MENPFQLQLDHYLAEAFHAKASDIHIEPMKDDTRIRIRVNGSLREIGRITNSKYRDRLAEQTKKHCRFDLSKLSVPQDSRFMHKSLPVDFRASLCPSLYGEKFVLRLLERDKDFKLANYPLPANARDDLARTLSAWNGLIVVSGPTGSGKSTLLYSCLGELDRKTLNIHTIEDPIEYTIDGLTQTEVTRGGPVTFADALRSLMRQDPDAILVGEIRDEETAEAALHAAKTGHLVLSTVHANSAREIFSRLEGLGCRKDDLEELIIFASAQRLVPRNCKFCRENDLHGAKLLQRTFGVDALPRRSKGCEHCQHTGVDGRALAFEHIVQRRTGSNSSSLVNVGSLSKHVLELALEGVISADEACALV